MRNNMEDFDDSYERGFRRGNTGMDMRKMFPIIGIAAVVLIAVIVLLGKLAFSKIFYGSERVDLPTYMDEYYQVQPDLLSVIYQDELQEDKAKVIEGRLYFTIDTVKKFLNEGFYADVEEEKLLYTGPTDTTTIMFADTAYTDAEGKHELDYVPCLMKEDQVWLAAEYLEGYANFTYTQNDRGVWLYTEETPYTLAVLKKNTKVREKGGTKSPILTDVSKKDSVEVIESMDKWSKVRTTDMVVGYVENKCLTGYSDQVRTMPANYVEEEYGFTKFPKQEKISMGWHYIGGKGGNKTLDAMIKEGVGMNVIAPTWYSLIDNDGNYRDFSDADYVEKAHSKGLQVWGSLDNFNYKNERNADISTYAILSSTTKRQRLVKNMIASSKEVGVDGINIDYEGLTADCGPHFIQFLRELSVECRKEGLILSVANYVPFNFNNFYRLDIQGEIADYVIIMGYDEHYHGSGDPGSVASIGYVSNGIDKTLEQVPKERVINALAFYTILWKTEGAKVTDEYITLKNLDDFLKRTKIKPVWDEETCQNYAEWTSGSARYQIWLEDADSLKVKINVMHSKDIAGVAVWRLDYGSKTAWELMKVYKDL